MMSEIGTDSPVYNSPPLLCLHTDFCHKPFYCFFSNTSSFEVIHYKAVNMQSSKFYGRTYRFTSILPSFCFIQHWSLTIKVFAIPGKENQLLFEFLSEVYFVEITVGVGADKVEAREACLLWSQWKSNSVLGIQFYTCFEVCCKAPFRRPSKCINIDESFEL